MAQNGTRKASRLSSSANSSSNNGSGGTNGVLPDNGVTASGDPERYEDIMGLVVNDPALDRQKRADKATEALSGRLRGFRKWLAAEAKCTIHPALCVVNGEATDGTRNAPLLTCGLPAEEEKSGEESAGEARLGRVDGEGEQALYDRNIGCQIRATREIKKNETMMVIPRTSMVTPDLVASSDAGRAVLACCQAAETTTENGDMGFWDAFTDTAAYAAKFTTNSTGPQSLMKILQERKKVEGAVAKRETDTSILLADVASVSRRAPFLAFLIHQRFSNQQKPLVASSHSDSLESAMGDDQDGNALSKAKLIQFPPDAPHTFAPYARTLPSLIAMPLCWKRNELALLTRCIPGLAILQDVAAQTMQLSSEYTALVRAGILDRFPDIFPPGVLTWDRWVWAASIFTSRVLPVGCYLDAGVMSADSFHPDNPLEFQSPPDVWEELGVMIPFLDMLNHEIDAHQVTFKPSQVNGDAMLVDDTDGDAPHPPKAIFHKKVKKGSEVFTAYGKLGNHSMIVRYGMAQMNNFYEEVKIGFALNDAVGDIPKPNDYVPVVEGAPCVYKTTDSAASKKWWTDERLALLHREAGIDQDMLSALEGGQKLQTVAYNDGAYHPTLISACLVATARASNLPGHLENATMTIDQSHLNSMRNFMASVFRQKYEKLTTNLEAGLKAHYTDLSLWKKASEGGIKYLPGEGSAVIGWQNFFDKYAYQSSMEVEKHYYAMGPDSCTLTLYDGQLRTLHNSLQGIVDDEKFQTGVKQQLEELGYAIVEGVKSNDESTDKGSEPNKSGGSSAPDKKASPGRKKRNRKKNSGGGSPGAAGNDSSTEKPPALKLHIGNLSYATTPSDLYDYFSSLYGKEHVLECHIPIERATRRSRGFGFVTMPESIAEKVLASNQKHEIDGRLLKVAKSNSAGTSDSAKAMPGPLPMSSDRCLKCGYRPKYCECGTPQLGGGGGSGGGGPPGPFPPTENPRDRDSQGYSDPGRMPSSDRMRDDHYRYERERGRDYRYDWDRDRDYRYGRERDRDYRYERERDRDRFDRDMDRDYYDRDVDMDRDRYRYREGSPRHMDYDRYDRRSRSERSRERRRDHSRDSRSPSRRREDERRRDRDRIRDRERRPVEGEDWDRDRKRSRSRSRSRERSRKKKSKKRES